MDKNKLFEIVESSVKKDNCELVDLELRGSNNNRIVEIFIDDEQGVTTKKCADLSRKIGDLIDEHELITTKYRLDVSSPGVDRPLKFLLQYKKHINRKLSVELNDSEAVVFEGVLLSIDNETLTFKVKNEEKVINFNNIKTAKVLISF